MSARRYKAGQHPAYDETYSRLLTNSYIVNPGVGQQQIENFGKLATASHASGS